MEIAVDLHIHTALSPCGDDEMTPNNIVNMACLKELDVIAVTDHNSCLNAGAVMNCAKGKKLVVIPGMEIETVEEVHIVCLFEKLEDAESLQRIIDRHRLKIPLNEDIFGPQKVLNESDEVIANVPELLTVAVDLSIDMLYKLVKERNGLFIPAHVDRPANGLISVLGYVPDTPEITTIELSRNCDEQVFLKLNPGCRRYKRYKASDAHSLGNIFERECFLETEELSLRSILDSLSNMLTKQ